MALSLGRRRRDTRDRQVRLRRPVISVGNISLGGTGKTPVTALIARWLIEAGERPAVLSRGYGRAMVEHGVVVVSDGRHLLADLDRAGDEPLMLAREAPGARVLVCEQRALAGALAERALDATVHVLDDGFQHLQLARDIDLVVTNAQDLAGRPLPFGRLREPVSALQAADAVIFDGDPPNASYFTLRRTLGAPSVVGCGVLSAECRVPGAECQVPSAECRVGKCVALAGIARPEQIGRAHV